MIYLDVTALTGCLKSVLFRSRSGNWGIEILPESQYLSSAMVAEVKQATENLTCPVCFQLY